MLETPQRQDGRGDPPAAPNPRGATATLSAWAPLRRQVFLMLFIAQVASNVGTWMQNVGAQVLMTSLNPSPLMVSLVQTAAGLPILLLSLPAGVLGDVLNRRRLLLVSQGVMLVAAGSLGLLTAVGAVTPSLLLLLTFALGAGNALMLPAWQAIQPELVPREELMQASALNGVSVNVARAVGPAIGGVLVAAAGPAAVFVLNALSFLAVMGALLRWHPEPQGGAAGRERLGAALRSGLRYAAHAPRLQRVLLATGFFVLGASAVWGLLPVVAFDHLHLTAGGYGGLLASLGAGALVGSALLPRLQQAASLHRLVTMASVTFAATTTVVATTRSLPVIVVALMVGGMAWVAALASLNATAQTIVPAWVRSRSLALFGLATYGCLGLGSAVWGLVAEHTSTSFALVAGATSLLAAVAARSRHPLLPIDGVDPRPSGHWAEPDLVLDPGDHPGPVLVTVEYRVPDENAAAFAAAMEAVGRSRRRSGGERWGLFRDAADPERFVETYEVGSWELHLRQHAERTTESDRRAEAVASGLTLGGDTRRVSHLLSADPARARRLRERKRG